MSDEPVPVMKAEEPPPEPGPSLVAIGCVLLIAVSVAAFAIMASKVASLFWGHWSFG